MMYTRTIRATFKLRGTLKEINRMKARIAALSSCEEVYSMSVSPSITPVYDNGSLAHSKKSEEGKEK